MRVRYAPNAIKAAIDHASLKINFRGVSLKALNGHIDPLDLDRPFLVNAMDDTADFGRNLAVYAVDRLSCELIDTFINDFFGLLHDVGHAFLRVALQPFFQR